MWLLVYRSVLSIIVTMMMPVVIATMMVTTMVIDNRPIVIPVVARLAVVGFDIEPAMVGAVIGLTRFDDYIWRPYVHADPCLRSRADQKTGRRQQQDGGE
jgi:hypothetical protein